MFYRENGQFKSTYQADQQIMPIRQDRWFMLALLAFAFVAMPLLLTAAGGVGAYFGVGTGFSAGLAPALSKSGRNSP